jgi:hypothetical protein
MSLTRRVPLLFGVALWTCLGCSPARPAAPVAQAPQPPVAPGVEAFEPGGVGSLETRSSAGDTSLLGLRAVHIAAQQRGDMAEVEATHTFHNDGESLLEGTFRFPMPDGALLTGLAMMIDGKLMEGELVEREKARKTYEAIVDGMQDPALLEWEHGSVFKMRVFPIEPHQDKVVTIRYLTPLRRTADRLEFVQAAQSAAGNAELAELSIDWQGRQVFSEKHVAPSRVIAVPAAPASAVLRETRSDGAYSMIRLSPDWQRLPAPGKPAAKNFFVVVDTSRSALEEMPRELEALRVLLGALPAAARFQVVTSDLEARPAPQGLMAVTPATIDQAVSFVQSTTPDGASDLGRALEVVGGLARATSDNALLYLGDCEPTWGLTGPAELSQRLTELLPSTPMYPLMFGASVDDELAAELATRSGGRRARIRRREDLDTFARTLPLGVASLRDIEVKAPADREVLSSGPLSLEQGRELLLFVKAPPGQDPLHGLHVAAKVAGSTLDLLPRAAAEDSGGVARRFGAALVHKLEQTGQPGPAVVRASLDYGVISKLTSFLVLESEEAYARFAIERKQARASDAPRVTGANLESSEGADISADRVQPGDPEIVVDAERGALSVEVELPFGETKRASWDPEARGGRGAWVVRFLVPRDTPEGRYEARALIQHADGSVESKLVSYVVDNTAPALEVRLQRSTQRPDLIEVTVTQPSAGVESDLKRVELRTPSGSVYQLIAIRWGVLRALIPASELGHGTLRVVGFDQALNHTVKEILLP